MRNFIPFEGLFLLPFFFLLTTLVPLIVTIWVLFKIQSIDTTLKEISRKLDRIQ
ncbi:MAG: hypothetical protein SCK29_01660 [Bacillota bacterium]|nr:hypothetical protein [Bacillota bacterium]MDW7682807.1 hypothetical protein [Bacillota bacterium]